MNNTQEKVWVLQLIRFFMSNGYQRISIFSPQAKQHANDCWMLALHEKKYMALHISSQNNEQRKQNVPLVLATVSELEKALDTTVKILDITVNGEAIEEEANYGKYAVCNPMMPISNELLMLYPGLDKVLSEVNDVAKAEKMLNKEISSMSGRKRPNVFKMFKQASLSAKMITGICVVLYILMEVLYVGYEYDPASVMIALGAYYKAAISICGQYWRFISAGFLHSGLLHLFSNILSYLNLASITDKMYGKIKTTVILLIGVIFGNLLVFASETNTVAVGLSGGIYALFGATVVEYAAGGYLKDARVRTKLIILLMINIVISFMPNTSLMAHLGGAIAGVALGILFNNKTSKALRINTAICTLILLTFTGWLCIKNANFKNYYPGTDKEVCKIYRSVGCDKLANDMENKLMDYYERQGANYAESN